jgi:hypothetical protein
VLEISLPSHHDSPAVPAGDATGHCLGRRAHAHPITPTFSCLTLIETRHRHVRLRCSVVSPLSPSPPFSIS